MAVNSDPESIGRGKRIAIVLPSLAGGGVERVRIELARCFLTRGYEVDFVLAQKRGELLSEVPPGCRVIALNVPRLRSIPWRLRRYILNEKPDAMLAAMWPLTGLAGLAVRLSRSTLRLVVSEHSDLRMMASMKPLERLALKYFGSWLYGRADAVVAVSNGVSESLLEVAGLPAEKTTVIYNPIRLTGSENPEPEDAALIAWWEEADVKLVALGALKAAKDYPTMLSALRLLRADADARLLVLGEGPDRSSLETQAQAEGLAAGVRFAGFRPSPHPYLRKADVFVMSSRWEGLGNAITEALSCGCRVVSTDCPSGPSELLDNGRYGKLVPPGDPKALAEAIAAAAAQSHDPGPGIAWASQFSPEAAADSYLELLFPPANADSMQRSA